ncbi:arginine--tRNA ligase, cytoplasmic isoform X3 [Triticum aestivum]|uniref:arginine--tRNA ligase, cytoplasmic isoform X3 n=1 Tax=Triticum aestivum TaxID=4565 RepID=UPI001D034DB1|nr:arginine--tRNA ligase, cytoplasmic-like isoform X3 [Triticum aestivum]
MGGEAASTSSSNPHSQPQESGATQHRVESVKRHLSRLVAKSLCAVAADLDVEPMIEVSKSGFGDYQCNNAMSLFSRIRESATNFGNPNAVGQAMADNFPPSRIVESISVVGPGYVNIALSSDWIAQRIQDMLIHGIESWAPILPVKRVVLDFSSPNIAKEMHVGHIRSTIIGDTLARIFEFANIEVLRRNHVGDWGTQFGMLIEFLFEKFANGEEAGNQAIENLQGFYRNAKKKFDENPDFKGRAQQAVVRLQRGEDRYLAAWKSICQISRNEFDLVYKRLNVELEEKGESYYNPYIPRVLEELTSKGLITESEGARVIFIEGQKAPLIVVKRDGGFNYASTDLAALWYRLNVEMAEWIIYVTDVGQQQHFHSFFSAARLAGWLPDKKEEKYPKVSHVGFGFVLGAEGSRFRTRSSDGVVRLVDLLDEAKSQSLAQLIKRLTENGQIADWTDEELDKTSEAVGYGAVKYADLKNNRLTNYKFSYEQMLSDKGNTAVYLQYAHARICSIIQKSNKDVKELKLTESITLGHPDERSLGLHLIQFAEVVEQACDDLSPHRLCDYLYTLSERFIFLSGRVVGSPEETSRLLLCQASAVVMRQCFHLLGITPVHKL